MKRAPVQGPAVTLVIGSGSVKCAASIGVVKALTDAGIGIDRVVGCSGGALFAAGVALGFDAARMTDVTLRTWTRKMTSRRNHMGFLRLLAPRLFGFRADNFGLRDDGSMLAAFRHVFGQRRIEDTPIPLHITATDFMNGELVDITRGDMVDAIRASVSLPLAFAPVKLGGRLLVDGYMSDPLPVSVAMKNGSRVIVAVGFESPYQDNIRSASRFAAQLSAILANNLLQSRLAFQSAAHHSEMILILPQFKQRVRLFDTDKVPYIIEEGEQAALQQLPYLHALLDADRRERVESVAA
ncbi:patatin-like phospholipase family protein [Variovorax sp. PAMC26660]|uniref:patatin-like phospholipase family protein n=1 Tax=Variovorax sp. PAMC26660 TaxID=2762322 RepID=UPI00164DE924|nr:patatin-like phospholipase family protein [Variovorax sp. PAMC26660]QNK67613.1 patatin-like phospholipase family protein [Variovorax sp. PAMC26660]